MGKYHDEINNWIIKINTFSSTPTTTSDPPQGPPTTTSSDPSQGSPIALLQDPSQEPSTMTSSDPLQEPSIAASSDPLQGPPIAISRLPSSYQKSTSQEPPRPPPLYQKPLLQGPYRPPLQGPSQLPSSYQKLPSQEPLIVTSLTTTSSLSASSSIKLRKRKGEHSEGAAFKKSHTEGDIFFENEADNLNLEEFLGQSHDNSLNPAQMLLLNKGKKLREILIESSDNAHELIISKDSNIKIMDTLTELLAEPIEIIDEKSAAKRIQQWKNQEKQWSEFLIAAESYNLYHLMSFVQVYEDLLRIGEILKKDSKNNIKNVKSWVIKFVCDNLKISPKMEQRQRLGCDRLRSLFNEGITCDQLSRAGLKKCDFFTSQSYYEIFISQIPSIETRRSISSSSTESRLSEMTSAEACKKKKMKV
ncbi:unnamed protein product [Rhizophagus irregularis]|nr:unnamed protein product [Rhizophagus irregularis]